MREPFFVFRAELISSCFLSVGQGRFVPHRNGDLQRSALYNGG